MQLEEPGSKPRFVEIEEDFARFVQTYRGGTIVRNLIPDAPQMEPNADYYFSNDDVIAELKCLRTDSGDREQLSRLFWPPASALATPPSRRCGSRFVRPHYPEMLLKRLSPSH